MSNYNVEALANAHCECGENPYWLPEERLLLWTDIPTGRLFKLEIDTGQWKQFYDGPTVGGFTVQADGSLLLFRDKEVATCDLDGNHSVVFDDFPFETGRFNDVIADPDGRVYAGTMGPDGELNGGLFLFQKDGSVEQLFSGTACSNGMDWSPDGKYFYWTDSTARVIYQFNYDRASGKISNRSEFFVAPEKDGDAEFGTPDGMTIDKDGNFWSAYYGGQCVRRISPVGEVIEKIEMPVSRLTSCVFCGDEMNELFITSAGGEIGADTEDGSVYKTKVPASGRLEYRSDISFGN